MTHYNRLTGEKDHFSPLNNKIDKLSHWDDNSAVTLPQNDGACLPTPPEKIHELMEGTKPETTTTTQSALHSWTPWTRRSGPCV
jgi:hypothetical protein